jgi:hypothetical protein
VQLEAEKAYKFSKAMAEGSYKTAVAVQSHLAAVNWTEVQEGLALAQAEAAVSASEAVTSVQASATAAAATANSVTAAVNSGSGVAKAINAITHPAILVAEPQRSSKGLVAVAAVLLLAVGLALARAMRSRPSEKPSLL